jgi:transcriptional regulator with XRE-family HTH domain
MAVRTGTAGSKDGAGDLVERLDQMRLANDWSYRQLADAMQHAGVGVSSQTLHQLLTDRSIQPFDRTLYKIRQFLDVLDRESPRRKRATA